MTPDCMQPEAQNEYDQLNDQHTEAFAIFVRKWPNYRHAAAHAFLAAAIATADMMGVDAEAFIRGLRDRAPKHCGLVPPAGN